MTHIEQMIQDMCPNGVEFKTLGEVAMRNKGMNITAAQMKKIENINGNIRIFAAGSTKVDALESDIPVSSIIRVPSIIVKSRGNIGFEYYDLPFTHKNEMWSYSNFKGVDIKFVYYYLQNLVQLFQQKARANSVKLPQLCVADTDAFEIPLPPLEIQKKIVECLDKFSALAAELQAELQLRRKQYEYYRTQLLTPHSDCNSADNTDDRNWECQRYTKGIAKVYDWQWKTLGEIGEMIKGSGIQKSDFVVEGKPCIHYGQVHTFYGTFAYKNKSYISEELYAKCKKAHTGDLVIATTSEDVEACCKATAWLGDEDVAVSGDAHIYRHTQNPKYMAYLFQTEMFAQQKRRCATGAKVTRVHGDDMLKFRFPLPPLAEQARIVSILDKFEALTTSLSDGIPAEQAAQQKRYEYYRDKLLTFPVAEK